MPKHVRLEHRLLEGRFHVYTSPDVKGLHASSETQADAQRVAIEILDFFASRDGAPRPVVEFVERPVLQAAE